MLHLFIWYRRLGYWVKVDSFPPDRLPGVEKALEGSGIVYDIIGW